MYIARRSIAQICIVATSLLSTFCILCTCHNFQNGSVMTVFFFAGQSNMEGNVNRHLFHELLMELKSNTEDSPKTENIASLLNAWYREEAPDFLSVDVSSEQAQHIVGQYNTGFIDRNFPISFNDVYCTSSEDSAVLLEDNCGKPFGPELMFGRMITKLFPKHAPYAIVKVAKGGTTLKNDWISPSGSGGHPGPLYLELLSRIEDLKENPKSIHAHCASSINSCDVKAFVWFQGENDCFDQIGADQYEVNLKSFILDIRQALGQMRLPVVIVEIGYWAKGLAYGHIVASAQERYVKSDPHSILVRTSDLGRFYHYDPAAHLIIGERVAHAYRTLLHQIHHPSSPQYEDASMWGASSNPGSPDIES